MPGAVVEYPALARYRLELPGETLVHEAGVVPPFFYLVLAGTVRLEVIDPQGMAVTVGEVRPGGLLAVTSVFSDRPTEVRARTVGRSALLAMPLAAAPAAFRLAPDFAVAIIRELAMGRDATAAAWSPRMSGPVAVPPPVDDRRFFRADVRCPACLTDFSFVQVRSSVVRPVGRDSDFRIAYESVDPSLYAVTVCPHCAYASYHEDFTDLSAGERRAVQDASPSRMEVMTHNLCGQRELADAMLSLVLAQMCADVRGAPLRRHAGLLHRRVWIERARGDAEAERGLMQRTRDAYLAVFEQDPDVQDAGALRVAYLVGDLSLRLGDPAAARRWLLECLRMPAGREQAGLVALVRARLAVANKALGVAQSA